MQLAALHEGDWSPYSLGVRWVLLLDATIVTMMMALPLMMTVWTMTMTMVTVILVLVMIMMTTVVAVSMTTRNTTLTTR